MSYKEYSSRGLAVRLIVIIFYIAVLYLTVPFARDIEKFLRTHNVLTVGVSLALGLFVLLGAVGALWYTGFRLVNVVVLSLFGLFYIFIVMQYRVIAERIHFIQYGILALLIYNFLCVSMTGFKNYLITLGLVTALGWGDELIQALLPERVYDLRDVFLNALAGALMLGVIFTAERLRRASVSALADHRD
jgi:hypothetical protein